MSDEASIIVDADAIKAAVVAVGGNKVLGPRFGVSAAGVTHWIKHGMPGPVATYVSSLTGVPKEVLSPRHHDPNFVKPPRRKHKEANRAA